MSLGHVLLKPQQLERPRSHAEQRRAHRREIVVALDMLLQQRNQHSGDTKSEIASLPLDRSQHKLRIE